MNGLRKDQPANEPLSRDEKKQLATLCNIADQVIRRMRRARTHGEVKAAMDAMDWAETQFADDIDDDAPEDDRGGSAEENNEGDRPDEDGGVSSGEVATGP